MQSLVVVFWQITLIFTGESKSFGTHTTEKPPQTTNANFGPNLAKNPYSFGRKQKFQYQHNGKTTCAPCSHCVLVGHMTKLAKNANIWPKQQIWPFMGQKSFLWE